MIMLVAGDTAPDLTGTLTDGSSSANLTGATVTLNLRRPDGTAITRAATIVDAAAGTWRYPWQAGELVQGRWQVEAQVTFNGGRLQTFPARAPEPFYVRGQIA